MKKRAGISLVALVITIIVLIILTGAVIMTVMEGGIIDRARESVFKNDIRTYQERLVLLKAENQIEIAVGDGAEEIDGTTLAEIQEIIPEFKKEYEGIIKVANGEIVIGDDYETKATDLQKEWLAELGIGEAVVEWNNSHAIALNISEDGKTVSGFKQEYITPEEWDDAFSTVSSEYKNLIIPEGVTTIGYWAFANVMNLDSVMLPKGVTTIGEGAFRNTGLYSIIIPEGVTIIEDYTFENSAISTVFLPSTINEIGYGVFWGCSNFEITYNGTKAQWEAISKDQNWMNSGASYTVHCSDGDITN